MALGLILPWLLSACRIDATDPRAPGNGQTTSGVCTPANGATGVKFSGLTLSWDLPEVAGKSGVRYDVFLGKTNPPRNVLERDYQQTSRSVTALDPGVTYYWEVDYLDGSTLVTGPAWSFTTASVVQNRKPIFGALRDTAVDEGRQISLTLSASDPDGDALTYSMRNPPPGAALTGNVFTWTPNSSQGGTYILTFVATEQTAESLSDSASVRITVRGAATGGGVEGKWRLAALTVNPALDVGTGTPVTDVYATMQPCSKDNVLDIRSGGTWTSFVMTKCDPTDATETDETGTWSLTGNTMTLKQAGKPDGTGIYDGATIKTSESADLGTGTYTFTSTWRRQ
jgi:hypothetical protein